MIQMADTSKTTGVNVKTQQPTAAPVITSWFIFRLDNNSSSEKIVTIFPKGVQGIL